MALVVGEVKIRPAKDSSGLSKPHYWLARKKQFLFATLHFFHSGIIPSMIELDIPGRARLQLQHLVLDVNGTLAVDGELLDGIAKRISSLRDRLEVHLLTADTHGRQAAIAHQLNLQAERIGPGNEAAKKMEFIQRLGAETVVAIGQGANDAGMLDAAALGICVLSPEGTAVEALLAADLVMPDIFAAFDLFERPLRIVASLRK